jgi:CRP-like cAMP-binding protein
MVGLPAFLGAEKSAMRCFAQIPGDSLRMRTQALERWQNNGDFVRIMNRYIQALMTQIAQSSACNRAHPVEERCARWLLMTHDRVVGDQFPLTHEFLAQMLGTRRQAVSTTASTLQRSGFIDYSRGIVTMLDRAGLEQAACECYGIIEAEYDRLLGTPVPKTAHQGRALERIKSSDPE